MSTKKNEAWIGVDRRIKEELRKHLHGHTWDDLLYSCLELIEKEISRSDSTDQPMQKL